MTFLNRTRTIAAGAVVCAVGFLTMPAYAHARPPIPLAPICDNWVIGPGTFVVNQDNNIVVEMDGWDGKTGSRKHIQYHLESSLFGEPDVTTGTADGAVNGNKINFRAHWDPHPGSSQWNEYAGTIGDDGFAHGTTRNSVGAVNNWGSVEPLKCAVTTQDAPAQSYSALAFSLNSRRWATAQDAPDAGAATRAAQHACMSPGEDCFPVYVAPRQPEERCVATAAPAAGGGQTGWGPDQQSAEDGVLHNNPPGTGVVSVCATGRPTTTPVVRTGQFPAAAIPQEIRLRFDPPTAFGLTAWVSITWNQGKSPVNCTFNDGVTLPKPFTVNGGEEARVDLPGIATGRVYNVVVTCGELTHSEQKQF